MNERTQILVLEYSAPKIVDGVIKGVKIIGLKSRNGRTYPRKVLREAIGLYESAPVFTLHPNERERKQGMRRLVDHFGNLQNVHERHGGKTEFGLYGNLHVKLSHPMAGAVIERIEAGDATFGLSHIAFCDLSEDCKQVLKIGTVGSVDLVDNPGTNENLFEEENMAETLTAIAPDDGDDKDKKPVLQTVLEEIRDGQVKLLAAIEANSKAPEKKKKKDRLSVLEDRGEGGDFGNIEDGSPPPIGNTHGDFMAAIRGFPGAN